MDDAGLLSGEKLTPQRIEPFQRLAHLSFRNLLTRLPRRAPSAHDNLGRSQQTAQLIDHRGFNLARRLRYRELLKVEDIFRTTKSILDTRPIYHQTDEAIRGHVFCSFLALVLRKALEDSLAAARLKPEWGALLRELDRLQEIQTEQEGKHFILRTPVTGDVGRVFQAVGIALPPNIREAEAAAPIH